MATNITEFAKGVQPDVIGCPRFLVNQEVVNGIIHLCKDAHVVERGFELSIVTADVDTADNNAVTIDFATIVTAQLLNWIPHEITEFRIDGALWETSYLEILNDFDDFSDIEVLDTKFFNFPTTTTMKMFSIDAKDQSFYMKLSFFPATSITTIDDRLYTEWHEAVEAWAKWKLQTMKNRAWSDPDEAANNMAIYSSFMGEAKIRKNKGFTKGSLRPQSLRYW